MNITDIRKVAIIDPDYDYLFDKYKWFVKSNGYITAKINGRFELLHRYLLNAQPGQEVDHINRNKLDNRISNLRFSNRFDQMKNATYKPGKSGIIGVYQHGKHWAARKRINGVRKHLGCFDTIEEAKKAYELGA